MPKNPTKAAAFYRKACSGGYAKACMNLGVILSKQGPSGKVESTKHYRRACALGDALGCGALGNAYVLGWGVAKDIAEGQRWLTKACKQHNSWACSRLRQVAGAAKR